MERSIFTKAQTTALAEWASNNAYVSDCGSLNVRFGSEADFEKRGVGESALPLRADMLRVGIDVGLSAISRH